MSTRLIEDVAIAEGLHIHDLLNGPRGVKFWVKEGYEIYGEIQYPANSYIQYMIKYTQEDWRIAKDCVCITKEMRSGCKRFDSCLIDSINEKLQGESDE